MKVIIDGTEYDLNIEKAKELKLLTEVWKPVKLGDRFLIDGQECVLCCSAMGHIVLIDLAIGYRVADSVRPVYVHDITEQEFRACFPSYAIWSRVVK